MAHSNTFRNRLRQRLNRFRDSRVGLPQDTQTRPSLTTNPRSYSQSEARTAGLLSLNEEAGDGHRESANTVNDEGQVQASQSSHHRSSLERNLNPNQLTLSGDNGDVIVSSDLWSAAYREAIENLGEDIDIAILQGKNVVQLFRKLEETEKDVSQESTFLRGVRFLHSLQVPLERFKLALDLASPLASIEPTATTVVGVVRSVTAIAISIATADVDFAQQIAEMLQRLSYIDDCDTLGQKTGRKDIHKALVLVYQKILEFYQAAYDILTRKGARLIMKMVLETDRLPNIIQDFIKYSDILRNLVQKATWEVVEDIKSMLYDHEISRWLGGDKMSRQTQYHSYLQDLRDDQACEFLLKNTNFVNWYLAPDSQQLVILGDMGSGKTVSMAFLIDELSRRNQHQLPQPKICYYYCRDDETGKAIYIVSALVLSLLEQLPGLKRPFFQWYKQAQASGIFDPATSIKKLEEFLEGLVDGIDRPVFVIIDGLDEFHSTSRNTLLRLLKTLSQKIPGFKTILSSRPEEEILEQLDGMARIELGSDAQRDAIIVETTVQRQLFYLSANVKALVIERLSRLAQGSAIWTKMIVELIEVRKIKALDPMRGFLEKIPLPRQLSELYVTLFSRCTSNDPENIELASTALKLLAGTHRPLSILELAWAATLGAAPRTTTIDTLTELVDHQRVMSLIHPFIARVDFSDLKKRQVRLVHQSVKEFIIKEWTSSLMSPALTETDKVGSSLEALVLDICIRYLLLDDIGKKDLFSEEQVAIAELPQEFDLFNDDDEPVDYDPYCTWQSWEENMTRYDPAERGFGEFFAYAACYWLEHYGASTVNPLPSLASIEDLCHAGSTRLRNWIQQNPRPDCVITARFEFDSRLYDPLSITSLYGSEAMLRDMLENSEFDTDKYLRNPAMGAADQIFLWGDVSRLRLLFLNAKIGPQLQTLEFFDLVIRRWSDPVLSRHNHNWDLVFDLVDHISDKLVQEQWGNELLCMAVGAGCTPLIRRLMTSAQNKPELRSELLREVRFEEQKRFNT
ncbi:hypothetical protein DTO212C5_4519 [Paecilomyces variotii]|nr:hypothetical protein DTO212C5_4519 [Paecilomyces variotii]